jgi:hypothetical protein
MVGVKQKRFTGNESGSLRNAVEIGDSEAR